MDYNLNDYITLRGRKLESPFNLLSANFYLGLTNNMHYLTFLYLRSGENSYQDIVSDLRKMGVGVSGLFR